jgi:mono/diheme cytochrome c family protein
MKAESINRRRHVGMPHLLGAAIALAAFASVVAAREQSQTPNPRGFDYWQPEWMVRELWGPGHMPKGMMTRLLRHTTYVTYGVPKEYDGARSTVEPNPDVIGAGGKLYTQNCAGCHGKDGMGDGDMGKALSPSPALLAYMIRRPISVDEYLLWAVSEGGKQFGTEMPSFKDKLSREEIWRIVAYMRAGFADLGAKPGAE